MDEKYRYSNLKLEGMIIGEEALIREVNTGRSIGYFILMSSSSFCIYISHTDAEKEMRKNYLRIISSLGASHGEIFSLNKKLLRGNKERQNKKQSFYAKTS
jgi:hypothetical protein